MLATQPAAILITEVSTFQRKEKGDEEFEE